MKAIVIMNLKGGVGKTITAINMAAILADKYGKRVLLIDADHQGNTSSFFGVEEDANTLREILTGDISYWPDAVTRSGYEVLDIIPANMMLAELDTEAVTTMDTRGAVYRLREFLLEADAVDAYDYVIVDMPPSFSLAAKAALVAADEVIVPIKLDAFSVNGMAELLRQIALMRRINPKLKLAGVLINMWHNIDIVNQAEVVLRKSSVPVFKTYIRRTDRVDESTFQREPLHVYSPRCAAAVDYRLFVSEYLEGGEGRG